MVNATSHWKPLVNGYSGFVPPGYGVTATDAERLPRPGVVRVAAIEGRDDSGAAPIGICSAGKGQRQLALVEQLARELERARELGRHHDFQDSGRWTAVGPHFSAADRRPDWSRAATAVSYCFLHRSSTQTPSNRKSRFPASRSAGLKPARWRS